MKVLDEVSIITMVFCFCDAAIFIEITSFVIKNRADNLLCLELGLIIYNWNKSVLESTKLTSANNRGESISYQKFSSCDFYKLQVMLLTTVFSSASDKAKLLYLRTMNYTSQVAHVDFSPETYLKWRNITCDCQDS